MSEEPVIPVRVRTARKQHRCDEYLCRVPILPGEKYELHIVPPHRLDVMDVDHWLVHKAHWPRNGGSGQFLLGCTLAAAYQEKAARESATKGEKAHA